MYKMSYISNSTENGRYKDYIILVQLDCAYVKASNVLLIYYHYYYYQNRTRSTHKKENKTIVLTPIITQVAHYIVNVSNRDKKPSCR